MAVKLREVRTDHHGNALPPSIYAQVRQDNDTVVGFKVRWEEEDENKVRRPRSKGFSGRKLGSLDQALEAAVAYLAEVRNVVQRDGAVPKSDPAASMTVNELFKEWLVKHASTLSRGYGERSVSLWDRDIATRSIAGMRLERLARDPAAIVRLQDTLVIEGVSAGKRWEILKLLRAVLRWGRRRHPNALNVELSGLFELPTQKRKRLPYAADAYGLERIIEAAQMRLARDDLLPLRDAALIAAMGFTIASRPSEWLYSARWLDLHPASVELQRIGNELDQEAAGLKTGARAALLLSNAHDRLIRYRAALEERWGPQPDHALIFQVLDSDGPVWVTPEDGGEPAPLAWDDNTYKRWTARVWRPAREIAAQAPDAPKGLDGMTFYDCRHTAISMALHSTLVTGPHGMNLHPLAGWAGHDIQTLQRYYAHFIARYQGTDPINLEDECAAARTKVKAEPFKPAEKPVSPQRAQQRRRRARRRVDGDALARR